MNIRKAILSDVEAIHESVNYYAKGTNVIRFHECTIIGKGIGGQMVEYFLMEGNDCN